MDAFLKKEGRPIMYLCVYSNIIVCVYSVRVNNLSVCVCVCVCASVYVCVCVEVRKKIKKVIASFARKWIKIIPPRNGIPITPPSKEGKVMDIFNTLL